MSSRQRRRLGVVALIIALGLTIFVLGRLLWIKGMAWAGNFGSVAAFFLALIIVLIPLLSRWWRYPQASAVSLTSIEDARAKLAEDLGNQWAENERQRQINDPYAMPVRWKVAGAHDVTTPGTAPGRSNNVAAQSPTTLYGQFDNIITAFEEAEFQRIIIVGPAGAGKSVLATQLAIQLVEQRPLTLGTPVPVILPVARWNPNESLSAWIAGQLLVNHEWLAAKPQASKSSSFAEALVPKYIIPILDGLDELPEHLRAKAIEAINTYGSNRKLVVTTRGDEYAAAAAGREISRATEIKVLPLGISEVTGYLMAATAAPGSRWEPVFRILKEDRGKQLAGVLSNPLMLWLARTIYGKGRGDPGELVSAELIGDKEAIENHLIKGFIPAVYDREAGLSHFGCSPRQAQRWLAFLAAYLDQVHSPDLEWWHLSRTVSGWRIISFALRATLLFSAAWVLVQWVLQQRNYRAHDITPEGLLAGQALGRRVLPSATYIQELIHEHAGHGLRSTTDSVIGFIPWHSLPVLDFWVFMAALCVGTFSVLTTYSIRPVQLTFNPPRVVKGIFGTIFSPIILLVYIVILLSFLISFHFTFQALSAFFDMPSGKLLAFLVICWVLVNSIDVFTKVLDMPRPINAAAARRIDLKAALLAVTVKRIAGATLLFLLFGPTIMIAYALYVAISTLCTIILGNASSASGAFNDTRLWLVCTRRLPLRIITFFDDALAIGILRQSGTAYQFRHILLQRYLSVQHPRWSRRIVALAVRRANKSIRFLEEWNFTWWWWSSTSVRPWSEPIWELRFEEVAALTDEVGTPLEGIHHEGLGIAQLFKGTADDAWIICAAPHTYPTVVAKTVWDALRQMADDAFSTLGLPSIDLIIPADADRVELRGGSWGPGVLLRDPEHHCWGWRPKPCFHFIPPSKWLWAEPPPPQLRVRVEAEIPFPQSNLAITPQIHQNLAVSLSASDLARCLSRLSSRIGGDLHAEHWEVGQVAMASGEGSRACIVESEPGRPVLVAEVIWSLTRANIAISESSYTALNVMAELRIEDFQAWRGASHDVGGHHSDDPRFSLEELRDVFTSLWSVATDLIPEGIIGDTNAMPPAGPPLVDLLLSATTPLDLLLRVGTRQSLSRKNLMTLISLLFLQGRGKRLRRGDLRNFVDFFPLNLVTRKFMLSEMSTRVVTPLQLPTPAREQLTREAIAFMVPLRNSETADAEWSDIINAARHKAHLI